MPSGAVRSDRMTRKGTRSPPISVLASGGLRATRQTPPPDTHHAPRRPIARTASPNSSTQIPPLLFPASAKWWLTHHTTRCRSRQGGKCLIFPLCLLSDDETGPGSQGRPTRRQQKSPLQLACLPWQLSTCRTPGLLHSAGSPCRGSPRVARDAHLKGLIAA